jgi:hypothetical protein
MNKLYRSAAKNVLSDTERSEFMVKVYSWMSAGVGLTAVASLLMVTTGLAASIVATPGLFVGLLLLELGLVFGYSLIQPDFTTSVAMLGAYAILNGVTLSPMFLMYGLGMAATAFAVTSVMFLSMAIFGYTTKKDLSGLGTFFLMALIGTLLLLVVEVFVASTLFSFLVSCGVVLLFAGLTAYDTQMIKEMQMSNKSALDGALTLYLDFINMFIHVLRIMGILNRD